MEQERKLNPMTIKSFTDLEQSKKLVEFLPLESADMFYSPVPVREWKDKTDISKGTHVVFKDRIFVIKDLPNHEIGEGDVYAWSLAALLDIYPMVVGRDMDMYCCWQNHKNLHSKHYNNPIDACVEMIEKLHKQNIL